MKRLDELIAERQAQPQTTPNDSSAATTDPPCKDCNGARFVRLDFPKDHPDFGKPQPCLACVTGIEPAAGIPPIFEDSTFETYDLERNPETKPWLAACERFALLDGERPTYMLMLHGDPGRGKTHLMVATLDALRSAGVGSAFWEVTELLAKLRGAVGTGTVEQEVREIAEIDGVLALDDIGPENKTGFGEENLYRIINRRWSHELPTIATCNSRLDDIDPRIRSRFKAGWTFLEKPGKDMRV